MKKQIKGKTLGMTPEEFTLSAIVGLCDPKYKSKGIHATYSGFNAAFRQEFPELDVIEATTKMQEEGLIKVVFRKGKRGAWLYRAEDIAEGPHVEETLAKIAKVAS